MPLGGPRWEFHYERLKSAIDKPLFFAPRAASCPRGFL